VTEDTEYFCEWGDGRGRGIIGIQRQIGSGLSSGMATPGRKNSISTTSEENEHWLRSPRGRRLLCGWRLQRHASAFAPRLFLLPRPSPAPLAHPAVGLDGREHPATEAAFGVGEDAGVFGQAPEFVGFDPVFLGFAVVNVSWSWREPNGRSLCWFAL
jgi:hypothetical protein